MNTIFITKTGRINIDENGNVSPCETAREGINNIIRLKEDTVIKYSYDSNTTTIEGKAGDLIITFYELNFPHRVIVVDSKEWKENLDAYEAYEQKQKEKWAEKNAEECGCKCDECDASPNC